MTEDIRTNEGNMRGCPEHRRIIAIHKKGARVECANYKGIVVNFSSATYLR